MDKLTETEKSVLKLIKNNNELVSYRIEGQSIFLDLYDGVEGMSIKFYIDEKGEIQARLI